MWERFKHFFVPSEANTYKPHFLERFSMGIMLFLVLFTFAVGNIQSLVWIGSDWLVSTILPAIIVEMTNDERVVDSVGTLRRNALLDKAAQMKAEDMADNGYFAHHSPDGISPWYWFDEAGYSFVHAGENLAVHFTDSGDVVEAWMKSPTHRANIMNGNYTEIGVGTAKGEYKGVPTIFVVQLFGTPKAATIEPAVAQVTNTVAPAPETTPVAVLTDAEDVNVLSEQVMRVDQEKTPEEEPVIEDEEVSENVEVVPASVVEEAVIPATTVTHDVFENSLIAYSDLATTTRGGVPAIIDTNNGGSTSKHELSFFERTATQPSEWMQLVYGLMALIVVGALLASIIIEWRRQNPLQIAYASGLLASMALLFHVHTALTSGVTIL